MNIRNIVSASVEERVKNISMHFQHCKWEKGIRRRQQRFAIESQNVLMQSTLLPLS
jgi:hypothetical protein